MDMDFFEHIARGRSREMYKTCVDYCVHKMQSERHGRLKVDMRIALDGSLYKVECLWKSRRENQ